jgi:hypothetical protein
MARTVLESLVADQLQAIRAEIVDLAASDKGTSAERRNKAVVLFGKWDELFTEWDIAQRALSSSEEPQSEYSITRNVLIKALADGGFRRGKDNVEWVIGQSINSFLNGRARFTGILKEVNGLVGKGEWPDDLFAA